MTENSKTLPGNELIDKATFEEVWTYFTDKFSNSDRDILHGYIILKAMCAILEEAFQIVPPDVEVDKDVN